MRRGPLIAAVVLLAACGSTKHTVTSGRPSPEAVIRKVLAKCRNDHPCRLAAGKTAKAVKPGQHLSRSQANAALQELERLCREQHTSCGEAETVFAEGHAHSKASSRTISKSALVELTE